MKQWDLTVSCATATSATTANPPAAAMCLLHSHLPIGSGRTDAASELLSDASTSSPHSVVGEGGAPACRMSGERHVGLEQRGSHPHGTVSTHLFLQQEIQEIH
eukprot:5100095-Prymnesium_polylepis.1